MLTGNIAFGGRPILRRIWDVHFYLAVMTAVTVGVSSRLSFFKMGSVGDVATASLQVHLRATPTGGR
jgi:hypothetical protein